MTGDKENAVVWRQYRPASSKTNADILRILAPLAERLVGEEREALQELLRRVRRWTR
jgi:hypothetical protein